MELEILPGIHIAIDKEDKKKVEGCTWYLRKNHLLTTIWNGKQRVTYTIGRFILLGYGYTFGENDFVCYKNKDTLDNRKENFIIQSRSEYMKGRKRKSYQSNYRPSLKTGLPYGVYRNKSGKGYTAKFKNKGKLWYLGYYKDPVSASIVVREKIISLVNENPFLNKLV
jgi:hypothetical protein